MRYTIALALTSLMVLGGTFRAGADQNGPCGHDHGSDDREARELAARTVTWVAPEEVTASALKAPKAAKPPLSVQLLGFNDFHGQLSGRTLSGRPVGGAAVLASYLEAASAGMEDSTFLVHAGDHVGATPPNSALLQDEPAITFLNLLSNDHCKYGKAAAKCNVIGTFGNHEFDEGTAELMRLLEGGTHPTGPFLENPWRGARYPYVSANVVDALTGKPIVDPYVVQKVHNGVRVGFIGAVTKTTPTIVTPTGIAGLAFLDEADAANAYISKIRGKEKADVVVLVIHEGGRQTSYNDPTVPTAAPPTGAIVDIVSRLHDGIDVVVSGHAHSFTNALLPNKHGNMVLVTQAFSASTAYADIDLYLDRDTREVIKKTASIVTTWGDAGPGLTPNPEVAAMTAAADALVAPLVNRVVGKAAIDILRAENPAGESALGNLIADAQRAAMSTDFAFMNPGGIRADLLAGDVTWGELFTIQPFGNSLVKMKLTGAQIYTLLEQQWLGQPFARILKTSGLDYTWDSTAPVGSRIVEVRKGGSPIGLGTTYSVTVNSFLAAGGDNFVILKSGLDPVGGPQDVDALIDFIASLPQPFSYFVSGRITRLP